MYFKEAKGYVEPHALLFSSILPQCTTDSPIIDQPQAWTRHRWNSPIRDKMIKTNAPNSTALRLPILVTAIVWTFSVRVEDPVPVPQRPAKTLQRPSIPIPRLRTPGVGGLDATNKDDAWYEPTYKVSNKASQCKSGFLFPLFFGGGGPVILYKSSSRCTFSGYSC